MVVELREGDHVKMRFLTTVMVASRSSENSTFVSWLDIFNEGVASRFNCIMEAFLAYWLFWYVLVSKLEDGLYQYVFSLAIQIIKGSLYALLDECIQNTRATRHDLVTNADSNFL